MSHNLLPKEIWCLVWLKLDAQDRIRFRAVSKQWMSFMPSCQLPWLMLAEPEDERESSSEDEEEEEDDGQGEDGEGEDGVEDEDENNEDEDEHVDHNLDLGAKKELGDQGEKKEEEEEVSTDTTPTATTTLSRGFVSLGKQKVHQIDIPGICPARCVGSTGNWLITAHKDRTIRLLNPFSRQQLYLPPQSAFVSYDMLVKLDKSGLYEKPDEKLRRLQLWKVILSSSPSNGRDCVAMAIHDFSMTLSVARLGDSKWTTVHLEGNPLPYPVFLEDIIFHKGLCYGVNTAGWLVECDIGDGREPPKARYVTGTNPFKKVCVFRLNYLVEWLDELLLVIRWFDELDNDQKYRTRKFDIYKFDFGKSKWGAELKSLGEHSLFLGFNTSVAVRASDYLPALVKKNCIYFTDDFVHYYSEKRVAAGRDMGVYDLKDNSISPHFEGISTSRYTPRVWMVPS